MPSASYRTLELTLLAALASRLVLLERWSAADLALDPALYRYATVGSGVLCVLLLRLHHWRRELLVTYVAVALYVVSQVAAATATTPTLLTSSWVPSPSVQFYFSVFAIMFGFLMSAVFPLADLATVHGVYRTIGCHTGRYGGVECRIFYPSSKEPSPLGAKGRVPYLYHGEHLAKGLNVFSKVPVWFFNNFRNAYLAAIEDAPLATPEKEEGWPLVIFSHGLAGSLELYSVVNQQVASEGNIVVVVNHCDGSASVARPDDNRVEYYQRITPEVMRNENGEGFRFRNNQLRHRVQEIRRVLNVVSECAREEDTTGHPVLSRADLDSVHVMGHSFGAATALTAAHVDERFRTAVLLDAWMEPVSPDVLKGLGARIPVLHLISDHFANWKPNFESTKAHFQGCTHPHSRLLVVRGMRHNNFSDLPLFSPSVNRLMKLAGDIDPRYALRLVGELSAAFVRGTFDTTLSEFPEVVDAE
ncbi:hypothetical protein Poli38472_011287 [Pythium oligandrum]|uniref:1-alkyl-2-acetylglycerophosphocholine esterase n=1 Tax=Pythium oligandrum TaxID=41045 RepID=A0A8K1FDJ7_PYTOL|nr:hypothetical protein Poli38472_014851 [Pythium oligandrum]TMW67667.1 hypothetical protein Poli38472_011287 [Pythium oligandrum]|eukprot:TMW54943.1 hypothetical protein Poli38472_014851 [Pythium oligandrum]